MPMITCAWVCVYMCVNNTTTRNDDVCQRSMFNDG